MKLVQTLFPATIDAMTEEVSQTVGQKPIVLQPMSDELLCHYLFGRTTEQAKINDETLDDFEVLDDEDDNEEAKESSKKSNVPHFGASQVVIVRDQRVKKELPEFMQNMLCLTVYESKGLEFDDVILYNFFSMNDIGSHQWKIL